MVLSGQVRYRTEKHLFDFTIRRSLTTLAGAASEEYRDRSQMREGGGLKSEWELEGKSGGENFLKNFSCEVSESQRV